MNNIGEANDNGDLQQHANNDNGDLRQFENFDRWNRVVMETVEVETGTSTLAMPNARMQPLSAFSIGFTTAHYNKA